MRKLINNIRKSLDELCPTFVQVPEDIPYPYITLEPENNLMGLPSGPSILVMKIRLWSQYKGTMEILKLTRKVEKMLLMKIPQSLKIALKIVESSLTLQKDKLTRTHTFSIRLRYHEAPDE